MRKDKMPREDLFEKSPVWNAIITLTVPMIISSLVSMIYNLSDTYFVGALNDSVQNAAITLTAPAMTLFYGNHYGNCCADCADVPSQQKTPEIKECTKTYTNVRVF